ncbi:uncharacterized protein K441DRAFT_187829 [Cenococcum geophilum 1.58]|uniref:uncharacterized protein n=1 Tax=Cenococcum geophilum 1.58 TaxID=794803 RepID=UPI00358F4B85|nr:hypothetical protein K441DRAFT_187829 [Cenococcum geophilum 1.58]
MENHFASSFTKDIAPVLREQIHRFVRAASYVHGTGQSLRFKHSLEKRLSACSLLSYLRAWLRLFCTKKPSSLVPVSALKLLFAWMSLRFTGGQQHTVRLAVGLALTYQRVSPKSRQILAKFSPKSKHKHGAAGNTCAMLGISKEHTSHTFVDFSSHEQTKSFSAVNFKSMLYALMASLFPVAGPPRTREC